MAAPPSQSEDDAIDAQARERQRRRLGRRRRHILGLDVHDERAGMRRTRGCYIKPGDIWREEDAEDVIAVIVALGPIPDRPEI